MGWHGASLLFHSVRAIVPSNEAQEGEDGERSYCLSYHHQPSAPLPPLFLDLQPPN